MSSVKSVGSCTVISWIRNASSSAQPTAVVVITVVPLAPVVVSVVPVVVPMLDVGASVVPLGVPAAVVVAPGDTVVMLTVVIVVTVKPIYIL